MALFKKDDDAAGIQRRIKANKYEGPQQLEELLEELRSRPDFAPGACLWMLAHGNRRLRGFAAEVLEPVVDEVGVDRILAEAAGKPADVQRDVARTLRAVDPRRIAGYIGPLLHDKDVAKRALALAIVSVHSSPIDLLGIFKTLLRDPDASLRRATVKALAEQAHEHTVLLILRSLIHDDDEIVRGVVIETLSRQPSAEIVEPFFERLPLESGAIRRTMVSALGELVRRGVEGVEERILPVLADEDESLRVAAAELLSECPDQARVLREFFTHCRGLAPWLRRRSMETIARHARGVVGALGTLMADDDFDVRLQAMLMATNLRDPAVIPHAIAILDGDDDWWVRGMAAEILSSFAEDDAVTALLRHAEDSEMLHAIIPALGRLDDARVLGPLLTALEAEDRSLRAAAIDALGRFEGEEVTRALLACVRNDPSEALRDKAACVLEGRPGVDPVELAAALAPRFPEIMSQPLDLEMVSDRLNDRD